MSTKVCHLTSVHGPHDVRIFQKMCRSLAAAGYEVYLVVANAETERKDGVQIVGVEVPFSGRISRMRNASKAVYLKALELDADIYHVHDPELIPFAVKLQKKGKKVIFDSHEDVPQDIKDKEWLGPQVFRMIVSRIYNAYEKKQVRKLSGLISVLDSITDKFKHPNAITIHNYPRVEFFGAHNYRLDGDQDQYFKLVYNGGLSRLRGIHRMLEAMEQLGDRYRLMLMGPWESEVYEQQCTAMPGWNKVMYLGNIELQKCFAILKQCQLGLVLFKAVPNHLQSLPNKSFEFIAATLPMLMSDFPFWREEFGDYAHFVDPENPKSIADSVVHIAENYDKIIARVKVKSAEILATKTWQSEEKKLLHFYQNLI